MVDAIISPVVENLKGYVLEEASLLLIVGKDVEILQKELRGFLRILKDVDSKQKRDDDDVKEWIRDIRDIAYDAEDVIEAFMLKANNIPSVRTFWLIISSCNTAPIESFKHIIGRCAPIFPSIVHRYLVGREIRNLKKRISDISEGKPKLTIVETGGQESNFAGGTLQKQGQSSRDEYDDTSIVGLEEEKKRIVEKLLNTEKRRCVISIVGIGGLGKTTLAKKVYYSQEVNEFVVRAWVSISKDYKISELLRKIMEQVDEENTEDLGEARLEDKLKQTLSKQRYLIVMDDVWDNKLWNQIEKALPDVGNGSRVIFTTRFDGVASYADPDITPYELPLLNENDSRKLFLKKIYPNNNLTTFPNELRDVGEDLLRRCKRLPLAIVLLGAVVRTKQRNCHQWSIVRNNLSWESIEDGSLFSILGLSYENLPYDFKPCFLYIGSFPEDSDINARRLMRLWLAEGFIRGEKWEDKAEELLEDLVQRSMIQATKRRWDDRIKIIRIHDHLRDFCIREARENGFLHVRSSPVNNQSIFSDTMMTRRLALHDEDPVAYIDTESREWKTPKLRTLLGFNFSGVAGQSFIGLKLLRVIDVVLDKYSSTELPKEIGSFIHLRYLRWWGQYEVHYKLLGNLHNLQTIDVRPLIVNADKSLVKFKYLQVLGIMQAGIWIESGIVDRLVSLTFIPDEDYTIPTPGNASSSDQCSLPTRKLKGKIISLKEGQLRNIFRNIIAFSPYLTVLTISECDLKDDPMPVLKKLSNLTRLTLRFAYNLTSITCEAGGFPQLQHLLLHGLSNLSDWRVDVGALPELTHLSIYDCPRLGMLPKELQSVTKLQQLDLRMPDHFIERLEEGEWEHWFKVQNVCINFKRRSLKSDLLPLLFM